ncbi:MAG: Porphobilinogen deaminase [Holophagaceae bacterium]|nr:Porphobilinogen deaminase [Holophagaceae bacterium]
MVDWLKSQGHEVSWREFTTHGDRWLAGPLDKAGATGLFTKELEEALALGEVDLLIHSLKDVAMDRPAGTLRACIPMREDPSDLLILRPDRPEAPTLGTSAVRRERMLRQAMPQAHFTWIRGNVPTRLQRVRDGILREEPLHGTLLAAAGVKRLGLDLSGLEVRALDAEELLPAPGQGALLAETRTDRPDIAEALKPLHDTDTALCVDLERRVLAGLGGGCQQPLGALAQCLGDGRIRLRAAFALEDRIVKAEGIGSPEMALEAVLARFRDEGLGWAH